MKRLASNTLVKNPETGERVTLLAGDEIPVWAVDQIGDHLVAGAESSSTPAEAPAGTGRRYPTAKEIAAEVVALLRKEMDDDSDDGNSTPVDDADDDADDLPPTSGRGSGLEAWAAYANAKGIAYPQGATRDEVIAAVEAHRAEQ